MPIWILKAALQQVIGRLPGNHRWNALFQRYVTRNYFPSQETFEGKLRCCRTHLEHYHKFSSQKDEAFTAMELGTGPWPVVPLGLYLCGAGEIWTYDVAPVLRKDTLRHTLDLFLQREKNGSLGWALPAIRPERLAILREALGEAAAQPPGRILDAMNIHTRLGDARKTMLPPQSIDLVFSTVTLEHIERDVLVCLFNEFRRLAAEGAVMSHLIGLADQYASFDRTITPYHFLKYTDRQWRLFNNPVIPQSRLRIADFRQILQQTGWRIVRERHISGADDDLKRIRIASRFRRYSTEDLLVLFSWLAAKPEPLKDEKQESSPLAAAGALSTREAVGN